jgi:hypothetical protein
MSVTEFSVMPMSGNPRAMELGNQHLSFSVWIELQHLFDGPHKRISLLVDPVLELSVFAVLMKKEIGGSANT